MLIHTEKGYYISRAKNDCANKMIMLIYDIACDTNIRKIEHSESSINIDY